MRRVHTAGTGPGLVLLHANGGDHRNCDAIAGHLATTHTVHAIDLPGRSDSTAEVERTACTIAAACGRHDLPVHLEKLHRPRPRRSDRCGPHRRTNPHRLGNERSSAALASRRSLCPASNPPRPDRRVPCRSPAVRRVPRRIPPRRRPVPRRSQRFRRPGCRIGPSVGRSVRSWARRAHSTRT